MCILHTMCSSGTIYTQLPPSFGPEPQEKMAIEREVVAPFVAKAKTIPAALRALWGT